MYLRGREKERERGGKKRLWAFQHIAFRFFHTVDTLYLAGGWDSTATRDESEIPGGFMSVMWKHSNALPALSAGPADTWHIKYGHVSLLIPVVNQRKHRDQKAYTHLHRLTVGDYKRRGVTWMNSEQQMKIFLFDCWIQLGLFRACTQWVCT